MVFFSMTNTNILENLIQQLGTDRERVAELLSVSSEELDIWCHQETPPSCVVEFLTQLIAIKHLVPGLGCGCGTTHQAE